MRMHDTAYYLPPLHYSKLIHFSPFNSSTALQTVTLRFWLNVIIVPYYFVFCECLFFCFNFCIPLTIINSSNHIIYLVLLLDGRIKPFSVILFKNGRQGKHLVLYLHSPPFCFQSINSNWNLSRKKCTTFWNQTSLGIRLKCYYLFGYHDFFRDSYFILMIMMIIVLTW